MSYLVNFATLPVIQQQGNNGASRQTVGASTTAVVVGTAVTYTNPNNVPVTIYICASALINIASGGGQFYIRSAGNIVSKSFYLDGEFVGKFATATAQTAITVAANASVALDATVLTAGTSGTTIVNASADVANGYTPCLTVITLPSKLTVNN